MSDAEWGGLFLTMLFRVELLSLLEKGPENITGAENLVVIIAAGVKTGVGRSDCVARSTLA